MYNERPIAEQAAEAKTDTRAEDAFVRRYLPFIRAQTAKFLHRPPDDGDDELSVALFAFHEAVLGYSAARGPFLKYAALLIRSRLIDWARKEKRRGTVLSFETPAGSGDPALEDMLADGTDAAAELELREAARAEIEELSRQMADYGLTLSDVAESCPRRRRTLDACRRAVTFARERPELLRDFLRTKRLPLAALCEGSGAQRKTLERHRKYLAALLLIYTNGYEIIRGHLKQVFGGDF